MVGKQKPLIPDLKLLRQTYTKNYTPWGERWCYALDLTVNSGKRLRQGELTRICKKDEWGLARHTGMNDFTPSWWGYWPWPVLTSHIQPFRKHLLSVCLQILLENPNRVLSFHLSKRKWEETWQWGYILLYTHTHTYICTTKWKE